MKNLTKTYYLERINCKERVEYFVISNPPKDKDSLLNLISRHFKSFTGNDTIEKYYYYSHFYYKETLFTPRDYKEEWKGYFDHDYIENYNKDLLIKIRIQPKFNEQVINIMKRNEEGEIVQKWREE